MQNAAKYAGSGARATVELWEEAGSLLNEVSDDGVGFDATHSNASAGLTNMSDRLGAVGGTLSIESEPGRVLAPEARSRSATIRRSRCERAPAGILLAGNG